ncbi:MAG: ROK family protein [DPANN group archaeon]|nr:ROK family protein [DPANN group archaeon]
MDLVIGLDIGATTLKAGLVTRSGKVLRTAIVKTGSPKGKEAVIANIHAVIGKIFDKRVRAIGIGSPGPLDTERGIILRTPNIPLYKVNLKRLVRSWFHVPVSLENDASSYILGEAIYGAGKGKRVVIGLTIGTGCGGGIVIDKQLFKGRGNAGELGHTCIKYDGLRNRLGNDGDLEEYVSIRGVINRARKMGIRVETPKDLFDLARKKHALAAKIWGKEGFYLGVAVTNLIHSFDPDVVIIGGNIANAWQYLGRCVKETVRQRVLFSPPPIVKRKLAGKAGILGNAYLAWQRVEKREGKRKRTQKTRKT